MKKTIKQHLEDNNTTCRGQQHNTQRTAYINNNNLQQCTTIFIHVHADQKNTAIIDLNCISFYKAPRRHSWCFKVPATSLVYTLKMCMYI